MCVLAAVALLASLTVAMHGDSSRVDSLAGKLRCTCGCGDVLAECSHTKCETKASLKGELAAAILQGQSDEQIVDMMGARHGATILLTPAFKGFNTLLWIVPIALSVVGVTLVVFGRIWSRRRRDNAG